MNRPSRGVALVCLTVGFSACPPPRPVFNDTSADAPVSSRDTDSDGLCDRTELERGLDPRNADSDNDGFSDLAEVQIASDPLRAASPDRGSVVLLSTERLANTSEAVAFTVRGEGGDYSGAFIARPRPFSSGDSASDFYVRTSALGAEPAANVRGLEGETFRGVTGRTLLNYQVSFQYQGDSLVECMNAYSFLMQARLDGVSSVGTQAHILVTAPPAMMPGTGNWCVPSSCF